MLVCFTSLHKLAELGHELVDVSKRAVYAGETNIGDLVGLTQARHRFFADDGRAYFLVTTFLKIALDGIGHGIDLGDADGALAA